MYEIEVKVLDIDRPAVDAKLRELGVEPGPEERLTAVFFDFPGGRLRSAGQLLRLRREGERNRLTFKRRVNEQGAKVREEIEVGVSDFETCRQLLGALGLAEAAHVEKFRTNYRLDNASIAIDRHVGELAFIPEFLEIEAGSVEEVHFVAARLGFSPDKLRPWGLPQVIEYYHGRT
jgi:predicted adenylyl cyclase CyaB